jgi:hypothetical protein
MVNGRELYLNYRMCTDFERLKMSASSRRNPCYILLVMPTESCFDRQLVIYVRVFSIHKPVHMTEQHRERKRVSAAWRGD